MGTRNRLCILIISVLSACAPLCAAPPVPGPANLETNVQAVLRRSGYATRGVAISVVDSRGHVLVGINAREAMKPASNMKLVTTLAALELLGPDFEYETRLIATTPLQDGVIRGDVIVHSTGDPNISGRFYGDDPVALFRKWARELHAQGLRVIAGNLVADDSYFDDIRFLPTWKIAQEGRWYSAQISCLNLNDNCLDVRIVPGASGRSARVEAVPLSDFITLEGSPRTITSGKYNVLIHRPTGTNRIKISGTISRKASNWIDYVTVHDPALFFVHTLARVFKEEGITLRGAVRRGAGAAKIDADGKFTPNGQTLLVLHKSSLRLDLPVINKRSQNLHAEVLLKALGARSEGTGSVEAGGRAIRKLLEKRSLPTSALVVADGSGLSHENRVTTEMIATTLHAAKARPYFKCFLESLSVAGHPDGTLRKRFKSSTRARQLHERVFAKTGYILGVHALSGYLERDNTRWAFSIILNNPKGKVGAWDLIERVVIAVDDQMKDAAPPGHTRL